MANNSECVKVAVRVRPLNTKEIDENHESIIEIDRACNPNQLYVQSVGFTGNESVKTYAFDHVFGASENQSDVYSECASPIVDSVLKGYNGTIFAYGQTGTGKTFTMEGIINDDQHKGITPRTFTQIINYVNNSAENIEFLVRISFLEIYQDEVYDLLSKNTRQKMSVKEGKNGFYVKNLTMYSVKSVRDMLKVLKKGQKSRAVGATAMNPGSSRSHSILTVIVESSRKGDDGEDHYILGKLNLVDLAGSERQKKTKASGDRLDEAKFINLSLSALGNVIKALVNVKSSHIPFRDSKLTRLLSDSLGGNTKTVMIANIGPSQNNLDETMSSLRYANRAKNIKNKPRINEDPKDAMIRKMKLELQNLQKQLKGEEIVLNKKILNKKVIKKVEVWRGVSKEEVQQLKLKAISAKNKLKETHKKDEEKYENARISAEKSAKIAENNLKIAETKLENEHCELAELEEKLELKTAQLIHGGNTLNSALFAEKELVETQRKLIESEKYQQHFISELDSMIQNEEHFSGKFGAIHQEIADTTHKLKTLWKKYQEKTAELKDLEEENEMEEKELSDNINTLTQQFELKSTVLRYFIPQKWLEFIEEHSEWDTQIDQWRIPALEYSGNNMLRQKEMTINDEYYDERPLTKKRMKQIWKRVKMLNDDDDDSDDSIDTEIQEAINIAINTNIDPNQYRDKLYVSYGVDIDTLKKRAKAKKHK